MKNSTRVILNTGILYTRMAITMCIALLSTRWILQALGTEDYGIYSLSSTYKCNFLGADNKQ